jgi:hypothetical protein
MMMRAQFTRADLQQAFDDYAEVNGREAALGVLADTTGTRDLTAVPEHRIIVAMAALIGGLSFGGGSPKIEVKASPVARLKLVQDNLNAMSQKFFARKEADVGRS